jgi:gamma-glutamylcyclotransferase (GGCT)/AIG2-like uncharacterized protein YtfP
LLSWPSQEQFVKKIEEADLIEGDEYERKIVDVQLTNGDRKRAYMYLAKSTPTDGTWKRLTSGDWLQRHSS